MKIQSLGVVKVRVPLARPYVISRGAVHAFENILVRLHAEDGLVGLGECTVLSVVGDVDSAARRLREQVAPRLVGLDSFDVEAIVQSLEPASWPDLGPVAAIDFALWDLNGKALGRPAYQLLGGLVNPRVPVDYTLGEEPPETMARRALEMVEQGGFRAFCVKVGGQSSLDEDVARVRAVRQALGPQARIRADANGGFDADGAIALLRAVEPYGLEFIEQPVPRGDFEGLRRVAAAVQTLISVDESLQQLSDAYALAQTGAVKVFNIKVPKCGGLLLSRKIAAVAEAAGIACICGGALALEVIRQASRHFVAGTYLGRHDYAHEGPGPASQALVGNLTRRVIGYEDVRRWQGQVEIDAEPGLGVEEDIESVRRFSVA